MHSRRSRVMASLSLATIALSCPQHWGPGRANADEWFSHDVNTVALPPPPANGVFAAPDVMDIFFSTALIRTAPGPNLGNILAVDNPLGLGLQPGDDIDALHHELRTLGNSYAWFPAVVFTVDAGALGLAGTSVATQAPQNAADLFESNGFGFQALDRNENQIGLAATRRTDVDGVFLTPIANVNVAGWVYFSLKPGSPTLALLGASPADVLAAKLGGPPTVAIKASQLGLDAAHDDIDGLIMLDGADVNDDGNFESASDGRPLVLFSVSANSTGLPGTAVRTESGIDPPVGGDVYISSCLGTNNLFFDDGTYGLGLANKDNIDGLDLPEMAVPPGFPGGGGFPPGTPFTGGATTPGAPGTPGGPPLPPPPGGGGGGGPLSSAQIGLCKKGNSDGFCTLTIKVSMTCGLGQNCDQSIDVRVPCDDCDDSNGSEITQAVTLIGAALAGMKVSCPGATPDAGKPIFAGPGVVAHPNPTHANVTLPVNGALGDCVVNSVFIVLNGCDCYTQNLGVLAVPEQGIFGPFEGNVIASVAFTTTIQSGFYMFQPGEFASTYYFPIAYGSADSAIDQLHAQMVEAGFTAIKHSPTELWILADPDGQSVSVIFASGFATGGSGYGEIGIRSLGDIATPVDPVLRGERVP